MSNTTMTRGPLNGVDTPTLFATIDAVRGQRELARFRFRLNLPSRPGCECPSAR